MAISRVNSQAQSRRTPAGWPMLPWALLGAWCALSVPILALTSPLAQSLAYHAFADRRMLLGIPRAGDVLSNLALLAAGLAGLAVPRGLPGQGEPGRWWWTLFFAAVALTGLGSGYYHWAPDNAGLVWDRLPLSVVAVSIPAVVVAERARPAPAARLPGALWLALGPASVAYWIATETAGRGDLRPYLLVQGGALLGGLLLWALLPPRHSHGGWFGAALGLYALAKLVEWADQPIFAALGLVSGHTLKHLLAAAAVLLLAAMLRRRHPLDEPPSA